MKSKQDIERKDINANILEDVILRLDFNGLYEIEKYIKKASGYLINKEFKYFEDTLNEQEMNITSSDEKNILKKSVLEKAVNKETVYRFVIKEGKSKISISRFFIYIELSYEVPHKLADKLTIFTELIDLLKEDYPYVQLQRLGLRKINSIVIEPEKLLLCFEKSLYNTLALTLQQEGNEIDNIRGVVNNNFTWENIMFNVIQFVGQGDAINKENQTTMRVYQAVLDIEGYLRQEELEEITDFSEQITCINTKIFKVFKTCLTTEFLNDLISQNTENVMIGMRKNG